MKTLATIIFVIFIGLSAQAQERTSEIKVETIEMGIVVETPKAEISGKQVILGKGQEVARLYRRPNALVKKALSFTTKRDRAKLA